MKKIKFSGTLYEDAVKTLAEQLVAMSEEDIDAELVEMAKEGECLQEYHDMLDDITSDYSVDAYEQVGQKIHDILKERRAS